MRHMPGLRSMKRRIQTGSSSAKTSSKASTGRRKRHKTAPKSCSHKAATPPSGKPSRISCECQRAPNRTRCTASPLLQEEQEGKENEERTAHGHRVSCLLESEEDEEMGGGGGGIVDGAEDIFPDDDSNQILPVEQFFGNLEAMQDGPLTVPSGTGASVWAPRGESHQHQRRRRHYVAQLDSEEEDEEEEPLGDGVMQLGHPGDS